MATVVVTGYTAAKMQEIEQASVISGQVIGDDLVLKTKGNTTIVAGNVRGPKGDKGDQGGVWDATSTKTGAIMLAGNIGGTASSPKVTGTLDSTIDLSAAQVLATIPVLGPIWRSANQLMVLLYQVKTTAEAAVPKSGSTTALWAGSQSEYDALPTATKNAAGFVAVVKP